MSVVDEVAYFTCAEGSAMQRVLETAGRIAPSDAGVLLLGEPGTGKEALARRIHAQSGRGGRFVVVPCGSLDAQRASRELFGTGGGSDEEEAGGAYGAARGGTLLLEELAELPAAAQAALAFHLRSSGTAEDRRPVRAVATGTSGIGIDVGEGRLRRDLYDSLACSIELPPLRTRPDDVVAVFQQLWAEQGRVPQAAWDAMQLIRDHDWPGNTRELASFVTRLALMTGADRPSRAEVAAQLTRRGEAGGDLAVLPVEPARLVRTVPGPVPRELPLALALPAVMERLEYAIIDWALEVTSGNRKVAGDLIGLHRTTLVEKLRRREKGTQAGSGAGPPGALRSLRLPEEPASQDG